MKQHTDSKKPVMHRQAGNAGNAGYAGYVCSDIENMLLKWYDNTV